MQDEHEELTIPDVYDDRNKNLCNLLTSLDNDEESPNLCDSPYYTESDFLDFNTENKIDNQGYITIISFNVANLFSKLHSLKVFLSSISTERRRPDVIAVVETHLTSSTNTGLTPQELKTIIPGYNFYHRGRETKRGGGVGVFVSDRLNSEAEVLELVRFKDEAFENIVVKLPNTVKTHRNNCSKDLVLVLLYRQPNDNNIDVFTSELGKLLSLLDRKKNEVVIMGDMNLDLLKYDCHIATASYLDLMSQYKLLPRIVRPTRIKRQSATLIDHFFTQENDNFVHSGIIVTEIAGNHGYTDHYPIFIILKSSTNEKTINETLQKVFFTNKNHEDRKENLRNEDWRDLYQLEDTNSIYDMIVKKYSKHYHENKTVRSFSRKNNRIGREPWMTPDILADIRRRDRLARNKDRREDYRQLRNAIVKKTRKAQRDYLKTQIDGSIGNIKKHWNVIRSVTGKSNDKMETVTMFKYKGREETDPQQNAENMNEYLASIGRETNESVGTSQCCASSYLAKHSLRSENVFVFTDVLARDIVEVSKALNPKTSCDAAGIQQNIVLSDIDILAPMLAHLVNVSQKTGVFPDKAKIARVYEEGKIECEEAKEREGVEEEEKVE